MKTKKLKAYFWKPDKDSDTGVAVIAESNKEAKELGFRWWGKEIGHDEYDAWIYQRCSLIKDAKLNGTEEKGAFDDYVEGLKKNLYAWVEDEIPCDHCKQIQLHITQENVYKNKIICNDCIEKRGENMSTEIKGILHLAAESESFEKNVLANKEISMGVCLSSEWEMDRVNVFLNDKDGNTIGNLEFDSSEFQSVMSEIMPPTMEQLKKQKEPTEEEKKELEQQLKEETEYLNKNPIKKEIAEYHK